MPTAIKIENLSKQYRLGTIGTGTLSHDLNRWWARLQGKPDPFMKVGEVNDRSKKGDSDFVWALKDINCEVQQGEVLGIIGRNGAGKSTLLKILSKVTGPTTGSIKARGRIASLLEVGTGFHPELTGRENIYLNGAILGMSKSEVSAKLDEIIDFAGVERYIDTPAKRYSSGMMVRLGFAVAAHLEPEILVVDEVLAVGDAEFQKKSVGKMQKVAGSGRTVLFVSHNMSSIRNLCDRVIVLDNGTVQFDGDVEKGIGYYLDSNFDTNEASTHNRTFEDNDAIAFVHSLRLLSNSETVDYSEPRYRFEMKIYFKELLVDVFLGLILEDENGNVLFVSSSDEVENDIFREQKLKGNMQLEFSFPGKILKPGKYYLTFSLRGQEGNPYHKEERAIQFIVEDNSTFRGMKNRYRSMALVAPEFWYKRLDE